MRKVPEIVKVLRREEQLGNFSHNQQLSLDSNNQNNKSNGIDLNQNYKNFFDLALDFLCVVDVKKGQFILVNKSFTKFLGFSKDELIGRSSIEFIHPDDKKKTMGVVKERLQVGKTVIGFENRCLSKDGSYKWLEWISQPDLERGITFSIARDITERKKIQEEIKNSEKLLLETQDRYNSLFNRSLLWVYVHDFKGKILEANKLMRGTLGYTREEILKLKETDLFDDVNEIKKLRKTLKEIVQKGQTNKSVEFTVKTKSGEHVSIEAESSLIFRDGKPYAIQGIARDVTEKKKSEEIIKRSEENYRTIFEKFPEGILTTDNKGFVNSINFAGLKLFGLPKSEVVGKHFTKLKILKKRDIPKYIKVFHDILIKKCTEPFVVEFINQENKKPFTAEIFVGLIEENGKIKGIQAVSRDITDKKQVLENLKNSEEKYRSIVEMSPSAICTIDFKGFITSYNQSFLNLTGLKENEVVGKNFTQLNIINNKELPTYLKIFAQILRGKIPEPFETSWYEKDGRKRTCMAYASLMEKNGKKSEIQVMAVDLTKSKSIEKEVVQKKEDLELINKINNGINTGKNIDEIIQMISEETGKLFNSHKASLFLLSEDRKYLIMKKASFSEKQKRMLEKTIGIDLSKFKIPLYEGSMYFDIVRDIRPRLLNDQNEIISMSQDTTSNQLLKKFAYFAQKKLKINSVMVVPLFSNKECFGILDISSESTFTENDLQRFSSIAEQLSVAIKKVQIESKLKTAHENLKKLNEELEEKVKERTEEIQRVLQSKDEFINQLGHDLKNPLNPLINLLPLLQEREVDEKRKEIFSVVNRNVDYMKNLVIKTIELAKLNSPDTEFSIEETNLFEEANAAIEKNILLFPEKNIEIINNIPENIEVLADKLRLEELFDNLLSNASKYNLETGNIVLDAHEDRGIVTVSVKDSGIGMTKDQISAIFEEFYKADSSRHDFESSGLGMSICRRIVEKHGGNIWVESPGLNKGSTFYFSIPSA